MKDVGDIEIIHVEDPPGSHRRACDGELLEEGRENRLQQLCPGCRIRTWEMPKSKVAT